MRKTGTGLGLSGKLSRLPGMRGNPDRSQERTERAEQRNTVVLPPRVEWGRHAARSHLIRQLAGYLADRILTGQIGHREARELLRGADL